MLGTIVNVLAIFFGSLLGTVMRKGFKEEYKEIIFNGVSLSVLFVGISGTIANMIDPASHPVLFIISLLVGGLLGQYLDIEGKLEKFGNLIENKMRKDTKERSISQGFVTASLIFCVGTMAIMGSLESGLQGVHKTLFAKAVLDGVISIVLSASLGIGVALSGISVLLYQGILTILAQWIEPFMTEDMIREISIVGGILIFAIGLNLMEVKKIKVGNLLPAVLIPVIYYLPFIQYILNNISNYLK